MVSMKLVAAFLLAFPDSSYSCLKIFILLSIFNPIVPCTGIGFRKIVFLSFKDLITQCLSESTQVSVSSRGRVQWSSRCNESYWDEFNAIARTLLPAETFLQKLINTTSDKNFDFLVLQNSQKYLSPTQISIEMYDIAGIFCFVRETLQTGYGRHTLFFKIPLIHIG